MWGSLIDAEYGWKDWCKSEDFRDCIESESFKFMLKDNSNIITIDSVSQLLDLPQTASIITSWVTIDFEMLVKNKIDAIQVNISNDHELYWKLYGWDCDSVLVMNKDVIIAF